MNIRNVNIGTRLALGFGLVPGAQRVQARRAGALACGALQAHAGAHRAGRSPPPEPGQRFRQVVNARADGDWEQF